MAFTSNYRQSLESYRTTFGLKEFADIGILVNYIYNRIHLIKEIETQFLDIERRVNTLLRQLQDYDQHTPLRNFSDFERFRFPNPLRIDRARILDNDYRDLLMQNYTSLGFNTIIFFARQKLRAGIIEDREIISTFNELDMAILRLSDAIDNNKNFLAEIVGLEYANQPIVQAIIDLIVQTLFELESRQNPFPHNISRIEPSDLQDSHYESITFNPTDMYFTDDENTN